MKSTSNTAFLILTLFASACLGKSSSATPAAGTFENGRACASDSDCLSAYCGTRGSTTPGVCTELCASSGTCEHGGECFQKNESFAWCAVTCEVTSDCDKGLACANYKDGHVCDADTVFNEGAVEGGPCATDGTCPKSSLRCADDQHCRTACETTVDDCPSGDVNKSYSCCSGYITTGAFLGACFPRSEVPAGYNCQDL